MRWSLPRLKLAGFCFRYWPFLVIFVGHYCVCAFELGRTGRGGRSRRSRGNRALDRRRVNDLSRPDPLLIAVREPLDHDQRRPMVGWRRSSAII